MVLALAYILALSERFAVYLATLAMNRRYASLNGALILRGNMKYDRSTVLKSAFNLLVVVGGVLRLFDAHSAQIEPVTSFRVPAQQMAIVQTGYGGAEVLSYQSIPVLEPAEGQVLVKVYAAAVNPIDWRNRQSIGMVAGMGGPAVIEGMAATSVLQRVPGLDFAGVVVKVGAGVVNVTVGSSVFAKISAGQIVDLNGGYAHYALAPADKVVAKPSNLTYAEAAGLGTVGITALRAVNQAQVRAGQRVFINGIAGGIGSSAAQILKARGAYVLGTASTVHHAYLKSIGVDEVIDYRQVKFEAVIQPSVDVVIETVGVDTATRALNILKHGGTLTSVSGVPSVTQCSAAGVNCIAISGAASTGSQTEADLLLEVGRLAQSGQLKLHVDKTFLLQEAAAAQDKNHEGNTQGKIILIVDAIKANQK